MQHNPKGDGSSGENLNKMNELKSLVRALKSELKDKEEVIGYLNEQVKGVESKLENKLKTISNLNRDLIKIKLDYDSTSAENKKLDHEIRNKKKQIKGLKKHLEKNNYNESNVNNNREHIGGDSLADLDAEERQQTLETELAKYKDVIQAHENDENNLITLLYDIKRFVRQLSKGPHIVVGTVPQQIQKYISLLFDTITKDRKIIKKRIDEFKQTIQNQQDAILKNKRRMTKMEEVNMNLRLQLNGGDNRSELGGLLPNNERADIESISLQMMSNKSSSGSLKRTIGLVHNLDLTPPVNSVSALDMTESGDQDLGTTIKQKNQLIAILEKKLLHQAEKIKKFVNVVNELTLKEKTIRLLKSDLMQMEETNSILEEEQQNWNKKLLSKQENIEELKKELEKEKNRQRDYNLEADEKFKKLQKENQDLIERVSHLTKQLNTNRVEHEQFTESFIQVRDNYRIQIDELNRELKVKSGHLRSAQEYVQKCNKDTKKRREQVKEYRLHLKMGAREIEKLVSGITDMKNGRRQGMDILDTLQLLQKITKFLKGGKKRTRGSGSRRGSVLSEGSNASFFSIRSFNSKSDPHFASTSISRDDDRFSLHSGSSRTGKFPLEIGSRSRAVSLAAEEIVLPIPPDFRNYPCWFKIISYAGLNIHKQPDYSTRTSHNLEQSAKVLIVEEVGDFIRIVDPFIGWLLKSKQEQNTVEAVYQEFNVISNSTVIYDSCVNGRESNFVNLLGQKVLASEQNGNWIQIFYPHDGWVRLQSDGRNLLEKSRFLDEKEVYKDFTPTGFKCLKFFDRNHGIEFCHTTDQYGTTTLSVNECFSAYAQKELFRGCALYSINRTVLSGFSRTEISNMFDNIVIPYTLVFRMPQKQYLLVGNSPNSKKSLRSRQAASCTSINFSEAGSTLSFNLGGSKDDTPSVRSGISAMSGTGGEGNNNAFLKMAGATFPENLGQRKDEVMFFLQCYGDVKQWSHETEYSRTKFTFKFHTDTFSCEIGLLFGLVVYMTQIFRINRSPLPFVRILHSQTEQAMDDIANAFRDILAFLRNHAGETVLWETAFRLIFLTVKIQLAPQKMFITTEGAN